MGSALFQLIRRPNASGALSPSRRHPSAGSALFRPLQRRGRRGVIRVSFPSSRPPSTGRSGSRVLFPPFHPPSGSRRRGVIRVLFPSLRPGRRGARLPLLGVPGPRSRRPRMSGWWSRGVGSALFQLIRRVNASGALSPSHQRPSAGSALFRPPRRRGRRGVIRVSFPSSRPPSMGRSGSRVLFPSSRPPSTGRNGSRVLFPPSRRPSVSRSMGSAPFPPPRPPPARAPLGRGLRPCPDKNLFPPPGGLLRPDRSAPGPRASSKALPCRGWWREQRRGRILRVRRRRKGAP